MVTVIFGDYEWDDAKAKANLAKHGVSFEEASTAFADKGYILIADPQGSHDRFVLLGKSAKNRILFVVHAEITHKKRTRIISARRAKKHEVRHYNALEDL